MNEAAQSQAQRLSILILLYDTNTARVHKNVKYGYETNIEQSVFYPIIVLDLV